ncbi:hypothetical protein VP01_281g1 [Puccinia sorghi]|uniref:tRNA-splicing endonuclease subunit Sen54 N-terminal domain-containing protein n=1 Tax=Puccinia sorghi TaxID=27349 RepID=A0A0L6V2D0_9BASI|nr:hypothetical protein VP01_281g1 [Puccinia sorghi]
MYKHKVNCDSGYKHSGLQAALKRMPSRRKPLTGECYSNTQSEREKNKTKQKLNLNGTDILTLIGNHSSHAEARRTLSPRKHKPRYSSRCYRNHVRRCSPPCRFHSPPYVHGTPKGVLFSSIGKWNRERKRLELAPEELLYLIERGTVQCWTQDDPAGLFGTIPISVQRAWAEIIGTNQLSLEKYQVYAYLKRLGYIVLRKEHVDSIWRAQKTKTHQAATNVPRSFLGSFFYSLLYRPWRRLKAIISSILLPNPSSVRNNLSAMLLPNRSLIHHGIWKTYESVFNALSLTPSGPKMGLPLNSSSRPSENNGGYSVFYYVYKPNNRFPKSNPPAPDFQVCVVE